MRLRPLAGVAVAGAAFTLAWPGIAYAGTTSGAGGVLSGNQVSVPVTIPVDICGNAIGALGIAQAQCGGGASAHTGVLSARTSGTGGVASGNQISVPVRLPVDICGNTGAILGKANSTCCASKRQPPGQQPPGSQPPGHRPPGHKPPCKHHPGGKPPCKKPGRNGHKHHHPGRPSHPHHGHCAPHGGTPTPTPTPTPSTPSTPGKPSTPSKPPTLTSSSSQTSHQISSAPESGILPITGLNLAGVGGGALALIGSGLATLFGTRRRRRP